METSFTVQPTNIVKGVNYSKPETLSMVDDHAMKMQMLTFYSYKKAEVNDKLVEIYGESTDRSILDVNEEGEQKEISENGEIANISSDTSKANCKLLWQTKNEVDNDAFGLFSV